MNIEYKGIHKPYGNSKGEGHYHMSILVHKGVKNVQTFVHVVHRRSMEIMNFSKCSIFAQCGVGGVIKYNIP